MILISVLSLVFFFFSLFLLLLFYLSSVVYFFHCYIWFSARVYYVNTGREMGGELMNEWLDERVDEWKCG